MSRQFDFERHYQAFAKIPQTASAKSCEQSEIRQSMSVESLAPSVSNVPTADNAATPLRTSENQLDAKVPRVLCELRPGRRSRDARVEAMIEGRRARDAHAPQGACHAREVPAGYKLTEVGLIPEDWDTRHLGANISLLSGHHVMAQDYNVRGVGLPYLTGPADFPEGHIKNTKFTTKPTMICRAGDILVTVTGSGSGTLVEADAEYCISRQLMAIRTTAWDPTFLRYSLLQNASRIKAASAGLIPGLSRSDILEQPIPKPNSVTEQQAIAALLSDVDDLIAGGADRQEAGHQTGRDAATPDGQNAATGVPGGVGEHTAGCVCVGPWAQGFAG